VSLPGTFSAARRASTHGSCWGQNGHHTDIVGRLSLTQPDIPLTSHPHNGVVRFRWRYSAHRPLQAALPPRFSKERGSARILRVTRDACCREWEAWSPTGQVFTHCDRGRDANEARFHQKRVVNSVNHAGEASTSAASARLSRPVRISTRMRAATPPSQLSRLGPPRAYGLANAQVLRATSFRSGAKAVRRQDRMPPW